MGSRFWRGTATARAESRAAGFYGLGYDRSERAVLGRLKEAHRFAARVETLGMRWREGGADRGSRQSGGGPYSISLGGRRERMSVTIRSDYLRSIDMEAMTVTRDDAQAAGEARGDGQRWRPRRHARCRMFKPAQVVSGDAVHECVLLDLSPGGAQVYLIARAELPGLVTLWLPGGESRSMRRRWQQGSHNRVRGRGGRHPAVLSGGA